MLVDAGILHLSAETASEKVNEVWEDIDAWWKQNFIQDARKSFCNSFAKDCKILQKYDFYFIIKIVNKNFF